MELLIRILTVLGLGAVELWLAIPAGLALQLGPFATVATAAVGAALGVIIILILGHHIRNWLLNRGLIRDRKNGRIYYIWDRCGVAGLGLLSPLLVGAPFGTAIGIALGAPAVRLFFWMSLGIIIYSIALMYVAELGLSGLEWLFYQE